jgi:hypothetical protein
MDRSAVVQGHLPGFELNVQRTFIINVVDLLPPGQDVVFAKCVNVRLYTALVTGGNHPHTTVFASTLGQRNPRGYAILWLEAHVGRVLVIGHVVGGVSLFDKQNCSCQNNIGPYQALNGIKNLLVVHYFIETGEHIMGIVAFFWSDVLRKQFLYGFQSTSIFLCSSRPHHGDRCNYTVPLIAGHLVS